MKELCVRGHITPPTCQEAALPVVNGELDTCLSCHSANQPPAAVFCATITRAQAASK